MRLFVAIDVNDAVRHEMRRVRARLETAFAESRQPRVTWVSPEVAHVTLRFLGEIDQARASRLQDAMSAAIDLPRFDVVWQGIGAAPSVKAPRVLWLNARTGEDRLGALADLVERRVGTIVEPADSTPFRAHLTLGRIREHDRRVDWRPVIASVMAGPVASPVAHVTLYQSRLSSEGPSYTALARVPLA
jgi:2'-5' RNA ligase